MEVSSNVCGKLRADSSASVSLKIRFLRPISSIPGALQQSFRSRYLPAFTPRLYDHARSPTRTGVFSSGGLREGTHETFHMVLVPYSRRPSRLRSGLGPRQP